MNRVSVSTDPAPDLTEWQRAALGAALVCLRPDAAPRVLARLAGGERCAAVWQEQRRAERSERARLVTALLTRAYQPHAADTSAVHPAWLERALAGMDAHAALTRVLAHVRAPGPTGRLARWLALGTYAHLVPMPEPAPASEPVPPERLPAQLAGLAEPVLRRALHEFGGRQLAWALYPLERERALRVARRLAPPDAERITKRVLDLAKRGHEPTTPAIHSAVARARGLDLSDDPHALSRLAARALAPHVRRAGGDTAQHIAQRLAPDLGAAVAQELRGPFGHHELATVPTLDEFWLCVGPIVA